MDTNLTVSSNDGTKVRIKYIDLAAQFKKTGINKASEEVHTVQVL